MSITDRLNGINSDLAFKTPVACASTGNLTLSGLQTVDGVAQTEGMRTLCKDQTDTTQNGIYAASSGPWTREPDFDGADDVVTGTMVMVTGGSVNASPSPQLWYVSTAGDPVPGTAMVFAKVTSTTGATGATGPAGPTGAAGTLAIVAAGGTADAITADYTPDLTLSDKIVCLVVSASANTITTPTFAPDGLTAHTITTKGGVALKAGNIAGNGHVLMLEYNLANTRWELLNPAITSTTIGSASLAGGNAFTEAQTGGITALASSGASIAVNLALNNDFSHTFTENTTIANPSNIIAGQKGRVFFTQHASSPKTLAFGSYYKFPGGSVPSVTAVNSALDVLYYDVLDATHIACNLVKGFA